jgi:hypothetical protein
METRDPAIRPTVSAANPRRRAIRLALFLTAVSFFLGLALRLHSMDDETWRMVTAWCTTPANRSRRFPIFFTPR